MSRNVLLQILGGTKSPAHLRRLVNLWPPFLGAGIRIKHIAPDMKAVDVEMKLRWWNANYVGTHFGGSLFAMTDPLNRKLKSRPVKFLNDLDSLCVHTCGYHGFENGI